VHGKAIVAQLAEEVASEYFPRSVDLAEKHLRDSQLLRARDTLIRNFVIVILKALLQEENSDTRRSRYLAALNATRRIHPGATEAVLHEQIPLIGRRIPDVELYRLVELIEGVPIAFGFLGETLDRKVRNFVDRPAVNAGLVARRALSIPQLRELSLRALRRISIDDLETELNLDPTGEFILEGVRRSAVSRSYSEANDLGKRLVLPFVTVFHGGELRRIGEAATKNNWVRGSFILPRIFSATMEADEEALRYSVDVDGRAVELGDIDDWRDIYCQLCHGETSESDDEVCKILTPKLGHIDCESIHYGVERVREATN